MRQRRPVKIIPGLSTEHLVNTLLVGQIRTHINHTQQNTMLRERLNKSNSICQRSGIRRQRANTRLNTYTTCGTAGCCYRIHINPHRTTAQILWTLQPCIRMIRNSEMTSQNFHIPRSPSRIALEQLLNLKRLTNVIDRRRCRSRQIRDQPSLVPIGILLNTASIRRQIIATT